MILSEQAIEKYNRAKKLMGLTEQTYTKEREDITKVFGANIFDMNSDTVNTSSKEFSDMVNFIKTQYIGKGYTPVRILIDGSASSLRNTGRAENLTHKELSERRARNLGAALLSALPSLKGVEIVTSGKGMNGDGTSGPSDVYGTSKSKGNGGKPPVDVIKAAQAGNRKPVLDFYRQYQFARLTFQGYKEIEKETTPKKEVIQLVPYFLYLDPREMTDLDAAFRVCLLNSKYSDVDTNKLDVFQRKELSALDSYELSREVKRNHPCRNTLKVKEILANPNMKGDIRFFVTLYVDGKIEVFDTKIHNISQVREIIARGALRIGGKVLSNEAIISSMFRGNDMRTLNDFLMKKYRFSLDDALRNFDVKTLSFKPVTIQKG